MNSEEIKHQLAGCAEKGKAACGMRDLAAAPTVAIIGLEAAAWEIAHQLAVMNERAAQEASGEAEMARKQREGLRI